MGKVWRLQEAFGKDSLVYYAIYSLMEVRNDRIDNLLDQWEGRLKANSYYGYDEYSIALDECIHDLKELKAEAIAEEEYFKDMFQHLPSKEVECSLWE